MINNLRVAVKRQQRIIIIFLLTIFIPSLALGIFGIRAIRSERFRLARQVENEYRRAADVLKSEIETQLTSLESFLREFSRSDAFIQEDQAAVRKWLENSPGDKPIFNQVFLVSEDQESWFPLFQPTPHSGSLQMKEPSGPVRDKMKSAERLEFETAEYTKAAVLYKELFDRSRDRRFKGQMLAGMARCLFKQKDYSGALQGYRNISEEYGDCLSSSGLPLAISSGLQAVRCLQELGDLEGALQGSIALFRDIVEMRWPTTEAQFKTYASLAEQAVSGIMCEIQPGSLSESYTEERSAVGRLHQERLQQWEDMRHIRLDIIPELLRLKNDADPSVPSLRLCESSGGRIFLVTAVPVLHTTSGKIESLFGAEVSIKALMEKVIPPVLREARLDDNGGILIADLNGTSVFGDNPDAGIRPVFSSLFEGNFPPWTIRFFSEKGVASSSLNLRKNFYLWTILTLVVVLIFGAVVISRAIAQETAVLNLKSDFVSAVSHEFKSPLTSIKSLSGRLKAGKVHDEKRMNQYFEVIEQDADRLMRLVGNILDFSKIEEGKREYEFTETDLKKLISEQVESYKSREISEGLKIHTCLAEDIPNMKVDREALSRAVQNLMDNALKFSPAEKEIFVSLRKDENHVHISVGDRGIGIPAHELERIFEKFYQGRSPVKPSGRGTGLGLTLVKHTAEAHGGRIMVKSRVGEGSTFTIFLPMIDGER